SWLCIHQSAGQSSRKWPPCQAGFRVPLRKSSHTRWEVMHLVRSSRASYSKSHTWLCSRHLLYARQAIGSVQVEIAQGAHAFGIAQLTQCHAFNLANAFTGQVVVRTDIFEGVENAIFQTKTQLQHL